MDKKEPTTPCLRCGITCRVAPQAFQLGTALVALRAAKTEQGLCAVCAAHWYIFTVDGLRWALNEDATLLAYTTIQRTLANLLERMHPELGMVDWQRMLDQWNLPWPEGWALPTDSVGGNREAA